MSKLYKLNKLTGLTEGSENELKVGMKVKIDDPDEKEYFGKSGTVEKVTGEEVTVKFAGGSETFHFGQCEVVESKNEANGSHRFEAMMSWLNDIEDAKTHDAINSAAAVDFYDLDKGLAAADLKSVLADAQSGADFEFMVDGEMLWYTKDANKLAADLQKLAREYNLEVPRFN
jgi:hypothetical protein